MSDRTLELLVAIAAEAATVVSEVYATPFRVDFKGPADPVTDADRRANELICTRLAAEFPGVPVVAEESDPESFADYRAARDVFFVDPVDGTNEFIERVPEFVVMIGLVEGDRPTHAVIHAPALNTAWAGSTKGGAIRIDGDGKRTPISVTGVDALAKGTLVSSRSHKSARLERVLGALGFAQVLSVGSAGLKGVRVAEGAADAYIAPYYAGKRWDACAAEALVAAAGGSTSDAFGTAIDYRAASLSNDRGMVSTNGRLHESILRRLEELRNSQQG